jgi:hypothetical protein
MAGGRAGGEERGIYFPIPVTTTPVSAAPHLGHAKHLCVMVNLGEDLEAYKALVKNGKFLCRKCGRVAAKEANLCEPVPL